MTIFAAASGLPAAALARDASISQAADGGTITVTASGTRFAGAIGSLTFRGVQYVDVADHGREIQSSLQVDGLGECFNPNEAGSEADGASFKSSSILESISNQGNVLRTRTRAAFWLAPGQAYGRPCSPSTRLASAQNRTILSDYVIARRMQFYGHGIANLITADISFTVPENRSSASIEAFTGYLPASFSTWLKYDRASRTLDRLTGSSANQRTTVPVIVSKPDGGSAAGVISPGITGANPGQAYFAYFSFDGATPTTKWSCVYGHGPIRAGTTLTYTCLIAVGNVDGVIAALNAYPMPSQKLSPAIPVFRFVRGRKHLLSRSYVEGAAAGYSFEGTAFHVSATGGTGLRPLYRCRNRPSGDDFISVNADCEGLARDGLLGFAASRPGAAREPLYRFYNAAAADHLATLDPAEGPAHGYVREGILGYVSR